MLLTGDVELADWNEPCVHLEGLGLNESLASERSEGWLGVSGVSSSPEVYPRPDGTVYMCGGGSSGQLPRDPASILPQQPYVEEILVRVPSMVVCYGSLGKCDGMKRKDSNFIPVSVKRNDDIVF